jgi:hypothetical protein
VGPVLLNTKRKGDLAELKVAADLVARGYGVAFPYGEDWDFDLVLRRGNRLERVQVKRARPNGAVLSIPCRAVSLTNGRARNVKRYTAQTIDWVAAWDPEGDRCYYIPAAELGAGMAEVTLRLTPTLNGQVRGIRRADKYTAI